MQFEFFERLFSVLQHKNKQMEQLIPVASKLQDVLGALGHSTALDLPQIVVVGGQSSGKSSVLEGIVGRSFLPRGQGIVTRRPLILTLFNTASPTLDDEFDQENIGEMKNGHHHLLNGEEQHNSHKNSNLEQVEWGEFLHVPGRRFYDFSAIREEIIRDTERISGKNKGIHSSPIHLKIFSPNVLALTLVDLPGMTKVAVGDQPADIEEQIRDLSMQYISNPNAIILAVSSANIDLANSDAIKLAQSVDPLGERTVGVITKLDLMDPGTDASDILKNQVIPLRRGYIGIVNRGQRDVDSDLSIRDGLRKEQNFFRTHPVYGHDRSLQAKLGIGNLSRALNGMLMHHIRDCLPELKNRISNMMNDVQLELDALGNSTDGTSRSTLGGSLLSLLSKFTANFGSTIDGKGNVISASSMNSIRGAHSTLTGSPALIHPSSEMNELFGGARISFIFNDIFCASLMSVNAFDGLSDDEIRTTICNANGTRPSLFVPEISFDILVRRQISRLEQPGIQCVDLVYEELQRISSQSEPNELTRFPILRERLVDVVSGLLKRAVGPTQMMVSNLVKIELSYINTSHPDFIGGSRAVAQLMQKMAKEKGKGVPKQPSDLDDSGATPLSSSSLSHYMEHDDEDKIHTPVPVRNGYQGNNGPMNENRGIMNFIFGGTKSSTFGRQSPAPIRPPRQSNIGPPSIVQLPQIPDTMRQTDVPPTDREKIEMEIIKSLIESYFAIVRKNFIDMVPKTIMYFLVNHVRDAMQNELVAELYRDTEIHNLMKEADDVAQRRKTCEEMKELLARALEIVNEVRDFNAYSLGL
jgi:dynamin 1-like protein